MVPNNPTPTDKKKKEKERNNHKDLENYRVNLCGAETEIFRDDQVHIMAADALTTQGTMIIFCIGWASHNTSYHAVCNKIITSIWSVPVNEKALDNPGWD